MPVSTIDPKAALVVVDLQKGLLGAPTTPLPMKEVVRQTLELFDRVEPASEFLDDLRV